MAALTADSAAASVLLAGVLLDNFLDIDLGVSSFFLLAAAPPVVVSPLSRSLGREVFRGMRNELRSLLLIPTDLAILFRPVSRDSRALPSLSEGEWFSDSSSLTLRGLDNDLLEFFRRNDRLSFLSSSPPLLLSLSLLESLLLDLLARSLD